MDIIDIREWRNWLGPVDRCADCGAPVEDGECIEMRDTRDRLESYERAERENS